LENEKVRVGEKKRLDVLSVPTTDGWETAKAVNDTLIIDNNLPIEVNVYIMVEGCRNNPPPKHTNL